MIVRAPRPDRGFTIIDNTVLRDVRLSYRARGILAAILSRPDNWRTDATQLAKEGREGRDAILSALRELKALGYMVQTKVRGDGGRFTTLTYVYDHPQDVSAGHAGNGFPDAGLPDAGCSDALEETVTKDCDEDGVERPVVADAPTAPREQPAEFTDWRSQDRALFARVMDCDHITQNGRGFSVQAVYDGLRKHPRGAVDWPGRYCEPMADRPGALDEWLATKYPGIERS